MIEYYASFQYDIPTCALYGWGPGRQVQAFIWERGQKVGTSGYQDWILKAIAQKITTDAGGSIGKPQQQSLRVDLLMMTMTQKKVMRPKDGEDDDDGIWATARSHSLIGGGGAAVSSVTDSQTRCHTGRHTKTTLRSSVLWLCHTVATNHVTPWNTN